MKDMVGRSSDIHRREKSPNAYHGDCHVPVFYRIKIAAGWSLPEP